MSNEAMSKKATSRAPRGWRGSEWAVLGTVGLGFLMTLVGLTIVNIAIPDMRRGLHASLAEIGWVLNAYVIVLAVLVITAGRLGDLRGKRTLFITGVAVFTVASAGSGLSADAAELIAARAVQGLGAALLMPQTMAVIIATFPAQRRGMAMGIWGAIAGSPRSPGPPSGACWSARSAGGGSSSSTCRSAWSRSPWLIGAGVALLAAFLVVQARRQDRDPLVPFGLFADRNYALMGGANLLVAVGLIGMALPLTIYLQSALGFSPLKAGLTMAWSALGGLVAPFAGRRADKGGPLPGRVRFRALRLRPGRSRRGGGSGEQLV